MEHPLTIESNRSVDVLVEFYFLLQKKKKIFFVSLISFFMRSMKLSQCPYLFMFLFAAKIMVLWKSLYFFFLQTQYRNIENKTAAITNKQNCVYKSKWKQYKLVGWWSSTTKSDKSNHNVKKKQKETKKNIKQQ